MPNIAIALLTLAALVGKPAAASGEHRAQFDCDVGMGLDITWTEGRAIVRVESETFHLSRKPSSLGIRYSSPAATLIMDPSGTVFVSAGLTFDSCFPRASETPLTSMQ
jgi:hypothetical protein